MSGLMAGPCIICGRVNYPASMGGPMICPACDCGHYDSHLLAKHNAELSAQISQLQAENETLKALRDELFERNAQLQAHIAELEGPGMVAVKGDDLKILLQFPTVTPHSKYLEVYNLKSALKS